MEIIRNYINNMFAAIPQTEEMVQLKNDIYQNMCEKYQDLIEEGKIENEAIGIIISEFGNIDELLEAYEISQAAKPKQQEYVQEELPYITMEEAESFMDSCKKMGKLSGLGVFLILSGVAALIGSSIFTVKDELTNISVFDTSIVGLVIMFIMIAVAVGLFIYGGMLEKPYEYMKDPFELDPLAKQLIMENQKDFQPLYTISLIIAVCLCVLSPLAIIISQIFHTDSDIPALIGMCIMLLLIGVAVFLFIYFGNIYSGYKKLLEIEEFSREKKTAEKTIETVASIVWPLVAAVYLFMGFFLGLWHPGWVIFPVTGILFGIFSSIVNAISSKE